MDCTMEERCRRIIDFCLQEKSCDPIEIFGHAARQDFVRMHGPEHHVLDGACLLTAFHNAGGNLTNLPEALKRLMNEGLRMPGAVCGLWGVCGAVMSIGAALAIIEGTGPLSTDGSWGSHMRGDRRSPLLQAGRIHRPADSVSVCGTALWRASEQSPNHVHLESAECTVPGYALSFSSGRCSNSGQMKPPESAQSGYPAEVCIFLKTEAINERKTRETSL